MSWSARHIRDITLPTGVLAVDATSDAGTLYAACMDGTVREVDVESGRSDVFARHESFASGVILARNEETPVVVSAGYDGVLQWHEPRARRTFRRVRAHGFWSWQLASSRDGGMVASVTGQYLCGGYRYEPREGDEPSVKVYDVGTTGLLKEFAQLPPVQSVAFAPDGRHVAAGNLMGDVRVWDLESGGEVASWRTPSFTGWGIIKGHYYTGGIFSMTFTPDGEHLVVAGMGSTRDPAAGNGRQLWQRFAWRGGPPEKVDETHAGESGTGLMETIEFSPDGRYFVMAGRIAKGKWNVAFFDAGSGSIISSLSTRTRVTKAVFSRDGKRLFLAGAVSQGGRREDGSYRDYGRIGVWAVPGEVRAF